MTRETQDFPMVSEDWSPERGNNGRFLPGQGGRPKGSRNKFAATTMQQITDLKDDAIASLAHQVQAGNMDAVRFVLERIVGRNRMIELAGDKPSDISAALIDGEISTEEAKAIATVIEKLRKVEDLDGVLERLSQLERLLQG